MKLFFSPASPYVRKVMVVASELGLTDRIEKLPSAASPIKADQTVTPHNPTGKVPTLLTDDGVSLFDSRVICEYLDGIDGTQRIFPAAGPARWNALREQAIGDGLLDAALLSRYETFMRPEELRWDAWITGQLTKIDVSLAAIEAAADGFGSRVDIGTITMACALHYLDFRFGHRPWRDANPRTAAWFETFSQRPSMTASSPFNA
jgi:glutathione S-transferase